MDPKSNQSVSFRSEDIAKTKAGEKTDYFVKRKKTLSSRAKDIMTRCSERYKVVKEQRHAKSITRRQYVAAWFRIYRGPILIIFLSVIAIAIILGIIIVITSQPKNTNVSISYSEEAAQEAISSASDDPDRTVTTCNEQINLAANNPEDQAKIYSSCANQLFARWEQEQKATILGYIHKADEVHPTVSTAQAIVAYEEFYGNIENAEYYRQIVQTRIDEDPSFQNNIGGGIWFNTGVFTEI